MRKETLLKLTLVAVAIIVLPWLFLTTLEDTIAEPYEIDGAALTDWTLVIEDPSRPGIAVLGLRAPPSLVSTLFDQLFNRTMTSMSSPGDDILPIVLRTELQRELGAVLSPDEILETAMGAGLDRLRLDPVCMAVKRQTFDGRTREFFFVLFDAPAVLSYRRDLAGVAAERGVPGAFASHGFEVVLPIAGSDTGFSSWWPLTVDRETDCQAPLR
jgi:hypothetical protein